jgi:hypothetical protein
MEQRPRIGERITKDNELGYMENRKRKEEFKTKLRKLFDESKKPEDITKKDLAEILEIDITGLTNTEIRRKIEYKLRAFFSINTGIKPMLDTQYKFYLDDKEKEAIS